ncbi:MAG: galactokinase [Pseudomonadota bacterium]
MSKCDSQRTFTELYSVRPAVIAEAPGRVNLIGEHTDYNGGMVLPAALPLGLQVALAPRAGDDALYIASEQHAGVTVRAADDSPTGHWSDHIVGALRAAREVGFVSEGLQVRVTSRLPQGSGLSSSAALIVATLRAARELTGAEGSAMNDLALAQLARQVENDYLGIPCGIMDQMAVALGEVGMAMLLNTDTLDYELLPLPQNVSVCVVHSGITRRLGDGRYGARKRECDRARYAFGAKSLCALDPREVESRHGIDELSRRRARHCATEHRRVIAAGHALRRADMDALGELMRYSHLSMRDDFEMSLPMIDALVEDAQALGAIGARLTGGGFGGCIVALLARGQRDRWYAQLLEKHPQAFAVI